MNGPCPSRAAEREAKRGTRSFHIPNHHFPITFAACLDACIVMPIFLYILVGEYLVRVKRYGTLAIFCARHEC